jgi:hypothetical protein
LSFCVFTVNVISHVVSFQIEIALPAASFFHWLTSTPRRFFTAILPLHPQVPKRGQTPPFAGSSYVIPIFFLIPKSLNAGAKEETNYSGHLRRRSTLSSQQIINRDILLLFLLL